MPTREIPKAERHRGAWIRAAITGLKGIPPTPPRPISIEAMSLAGPRRPRIGSVKKT